MNLWSKGVKRSRTGEARLESGDMFRWMEEICGEISRQTGWTCEHGHQISPVGHIFEIRFGKCCISFPIQGAPSKIHMLAIVRRGVDDLMEKCINYDILNILRKIHFNDIER